jgi:hypothetical protein
MVTSLKVATQDMIFHVRVFGVFLPVLLTGALVVGVIGVSMVHIANITSRT